MRIETTNRLTENQMTEILNLETVAFCEDTLENHAFLSNEINFDKSLQCFYMGYENDELIAFLTTFMPTSYEAEILAVTHPEHRGKGYFKKLFQSAKETLVLAGINKTLLVVEPKSKSGIAVLKTFECAKLARSEYRMFYNGSKALPKYPDLQFFEVSNQNKEIFAEITRDAFPDLEESSNFIDTVISSKNRKGYVAYKEGIPVGVFDFNYEERNTFLYGVGIATPYRGKGLGKKLVGFALIEGLKKSDKVVLDVDSENPTAFNLYKKCGFQIGFQVDYYRCEF
ncbi:GNAT family N-acetyltransferase [Marinisporobacter balticus]|uniref:Ribosomal protein S18 acetylase RimI-like enzyme n=1 Tax=Marinisporobacter balticus TaxID=2018667 RepID=A0A4R2KI17_9FIRM|nr:GNAT family N-acetyltransferase [Marinisporobacter balticus]TCO70169.1 ribosomal protein S18 acetylase RimI-like enzyme [Marinisporobacter balticus]